MRKETGRDGGTENSFTILRVNTYTRSLSGPFSDLLPGDHDGIETYAKRRWNDSRFIDRGLSL